MRYFEHPHDLITATLEGSPGWRELEHGEIADRIIDALERNGYPLTCLHDGHAEIQLPLDTVTPAESLIKALDRWVGRHASQAAREAVSTLQDVQAAEDTFLPRTKRAWHILTRGSKR